jgi:SAM-dependent methyltransferase
MKTKIRDALYSCYNRFWRYLSPRRYWEDRGRKYATEEYCSGCFPQDDWLLDRLAVNGVRAILEVGCGAGRLLSYIAASSHFPPGTLRLAGVDFSASMLRSVPAIVGLDLKCADATDLPFGDKEFDVAYTHGCLMHIKVESEVLKALRGMARVSRKLIIVIEEVSTGGDGAVPSGYTPNGLAYYWDYEALFERAGLAVATKRCFTNRETVCAWLLVVSDS